MPADTPLALIDWGIIFVFLAFSIAVGFLFRRQASKGGVESFFLAGRNMRWWLLGTSIVATTFASDTPLAITGWVAQYGIAGNWFWWGGVIGTVAMTVFFARKWRRSGVVTDAEIAELRYGGRAAASLRAVKALISCGFVNFVILGWVFAGMAKISEPFMDWHAVLGGGLYSTIGALYPEFLIYDTLDNTITIWLLVAVTLTYSALGGLRAVIVTDLIQFVLAMGMSVTVAWFAVHEIGGLSEMWAQLANLYPDAADETVTTGPGYLSHSEVTAFVPAFDTGGISALGIPFSAFVLTLGVLWWTNGNVDGSGYIAQRLYTAKDGSEAEKGALWYTLANFTLRSWPWIIAGVAALVLYPRVEVNDLAVELSLCASDSSQCSEELQLCLENRYACPIKGYTLLVAEETVTAEGELRLDFREDRERGYPALIRDVLPPGLLGLALASLMAAFMSTISTHINWGASYVANDLYFRFLNPRASDKALTRVSRFATVVITLLSIYISTHIDNIGAMWELWAGMMAGLGLPHMLRWLWWRANAWTEISGMLVGFMLALLNFVIGRVAGFPEGQMSVFPAGLASHPIHVICWISLAAGVAAVAATYITAPVERLQLQKFVEKVRPMGFWNGLDSRHAPSRDLASSVAYWLLGTLAVYLLLFGMGYVLRTAWLAGTAMLAAGSVMLVVMVKGMQRVDDEP
ncbi:MAG: sodium:solute symporter family protein [Pseudomonadota bacterium]